MPETIHSLQAKIKIRDRLIAELRNKITGIENLYGVNRKLNKDIEDATTKLKLDTSVINMLTQALIDAQAKIKSLQSTGIVCSESPK